MGRGSNGEGSNGDRSDIEQLSYGRQAAVVYAQLSDLSPKNTPCPLKIPRGAFTPSRNGVGCHCGPAQRADGVFTRRHKSYSAQQMNFVYDFNLKRNTT